MTITVLLPGASAPAEGTVIAVDSAALAHPCNWWVTLDWKLLREHAAAVKAKVLTNGFIAGMVRLKDATLTEGLLGQWPALPTGWTLYPSSIALVFAAHLGAKHIELRGEVTGHEAQLVAGVVKMLDEKGVSVEMPTQEPIVNAGDSRKRISTQTPPSSAM